ncbi:nectin-4-like isoform X3 [Takifugu flavidus]|uniref:nectin-4-like isoform X3 n=1 Tax=Takifugu flavidus TaxID=433684 RepID=UPI00254447B1|nr:nectin-4-like isoform X3 [Takifugu flavidus]
MCIFRNIFIFAVGFLMILGTTVGAPSVVGRDVSVIQGETGVLLCNVIDTDDSVAQISWERRTRGHPQDSEFVTITPEFGLKVINGDGDRVKFIGNIDDKNGSLELSGITLMDEGIYTCAFTLYPSGIPEKKISLNVFVPPSEVNITEQPDGSFSCDTAAKPKPEIVWTRIDGSWPESSVTVKDGRLKFLTMDASLNGLYQCEASNEYGSKYGRLYVHNNAGHCTDCWILFGLLISIIVVAGVIRFLCTSGKLNSIPLLRPWQAVQTMASTTTREVPAGIEVEPASL